MRIPVKKSALAAAVMAVSLLGNSAVLADGGRYHADRQGYGHHGDYGQQKHYKKRYHRESRYSGYHDRSHYYKGHPGRHVTNYYEYDDDDDDDKLLIGLAIGGLIGYAINQAGYQ